MEALATKIYTPEEAVKYLRMDSVGLPDPEKTLRGLVRKRRIKCAHVAHRIVFTEDQLLEYVNRTHTRTSTKPRRRHV